MSDPRDKKSVCVDCSCELADCKCDNQKSAACLLIENMGDAQECITNLGHVMSNQTGRCLGCGIDLCEDSEKSVFDMDAMSHDERIQFLLNAIKANLIFGTPEKQIIEIVVDLEREIFGSKN